MKVKSLTKSYALEAELAELRASETYRFKMRAMRQKKKVEIYLTK